MRTILTVALILASVLYSDTATQNSWSGGAGVPGPVTDWGDTYYIADQICDVGNTLSLESEILTPPVEYVVDDNYNGSFSVCTADLDGDGDTDVLGGASYSYDVNWWENTDGTGTSWIEHTVDNNLFGAQSVYAADVDGDGDTDILAAAYYNINIKWWENSDTSPGIIWTEHAVSRSFYGARAVYAADVDGDGDTDVLGAASTADDIAWWENTEGTGTSWTEHTVDGSFNGARAVYAADVDGDGDTDVLGAAFDADDITWWENADGTGTSWAEHIVDGSFNGAASVYAADVNGDGDTDVLGAAVIANDITWWENADGTGTSWTEYTVDGSFDGAKSVYATDVDGDDDVDVLGAAIYDNYIAWWENADGTGTSWTEHTVAGDLSYANSVYAADVDGNGDIDVLGAARDDDSITWWDILDYSDAGVLESSLLDANAVNSWELFVSNEQEPIGTSVGFQFRSSQDSSSMGAWSDTVFTASTNLSGILADSTDYVQYRVILQTADPAVTPELYDIAIFYNTLSIGDTHPEEIFCWDLELKENPSFAGFAVEVTVPQPANVDLLLYDVAGRLVVEYSQELPGGEHSLFFDNLAGGVYFCTMRAEDFTATERIVLLN
ncbi:MAG: T9SS type A sorting domain-containing protein [Candidatus Fermentibacteria bacterium]